MTINLSTGESAGPRTVGAAIRNELDLYEPVLSRPDVQVSSVERRSRYSTPQSHGKLFSF